MTAEQLRNSILQEAISGRLVPQDSNDEPASVLLQRIREEKARLVKEGKLKKKDLIETPIAEEEIPFEIPSCWEWVRLKNIVSILGDGIHGTPEYDIHGAYYFVNGNNLSHNRIILKGDTKRVNEREYLKYRKILNETTILVSINGTIGNVGHYNGEPVILGKSACYYNLMDAALKPYITTLMYTDYFLKYAKGNATGSTIKNVSLAVMNDFIVPLPPLAEQKRIVAKLEELLPIVEQYGKAQTELDELNAALPARLRQSILQEAISGKLVPQDPNDEPASVLLERMQNDKRKVIPIQDEEMPYEIPGSWEWVNLGSIVSIITGKKDANFGSEDGTYDFFTCSNTPIKCKSYSYDGDYLIMPGNGANIGKVIHYKGKFEAYQRTYLLQGYGNFDLDYLKYHLMCNWKEYNQDKLYGSAIPYIKLGNLMSYPVALPPLAEQERIVAKIEELFAEIDKLVK